MLRFKEDFYKYFWFIGGFAIGYTLISLGHASIATPHIQVSHPAGAVGEITGAKVNDAELDDDFAALNQNEGKYAESWDQQQRIRAATSGGRVSASKPLVVAPPLVTNNNARKPSTKPKKRAKNINVSKSGPRANQKKIKIARQ